MTATLTHAPKSTRTMSVRKVRDMLVVSVTLRYAHNTERKTYSVLAERDRRLGKVRFTFARHDGKRQVYHVEYEPHTGKRSCDCEGMRRGGFCCHSDALVRLYETGRLAGHDPSF